ncbi:hypothetical protein F5878DRAFT_546022 [Lentinula raphanica]|uniref:Uncharacterized protein n=1 Tax=Lentinula raphanica TaxID=153919 RepID=A0AA38P0C0_9AGAR|nr:hypothetical protein F5878DRAFT_546022 [Lentinula raphanica]
MHVRCFAHTINLTAKGVLRPFEAGKTQPSEPDENESREDMDELASELRDLEENGAQERDDNEGFVDVLNEMSAGERATWQNEVTPVKSALYKTRKISFKIIHSTTGLLPRWREQVSDTEFADQVLPRDVATRWNSTYDMLAAFLRMKEPVVKFLDRASYGLSALALNDNEWDAIQGLVAVLKVSDFLFLSLTLLTYNP